MLSATLVQVLFENFIIEKNHEVLQHERKTRYKFKKSDILQGTVKVLDFFPLALPHFTLAHVLFIFGIVDNMF